MIKEINTPDGPKMMLLGFQAIKVLAESNSQGLSEISMIEKVALSGFNTFEKRNNLDLTTKEQLEEWFDDLDFFFEIKQAVEDFAENFTQKVSQIEAMKSKKKKK